MCMCEFEIFFLVSILKHIYIFLSFISVHVIELTDEFHIALNRIFFNFHVLKNQIFVKRVSGYYKFGSNQKIERNTETEISELGYGCMKLSHRMHEIDINTVRKMAR